MAEKIIVVGSSTGGTEALKVFLSGLPQQAPAILIAQHMPELFTKSFAERLDHLCALRVKEAEHHEFIEAGRVYLAPGHSHLYAGARRGKVSHRAQPGAAGEPPPSFGRSAVPFRRASIWGETRSA